MKRLFVFGCSYTSWMTPTWADFLATGYDQFENWAIEGIGNRAIVERLSECLLSRNINENDTVIVQWTEPHREDYHRPDLLPTTNWSRMGNIFNPGTSKIIVDSWNEKSYLMHSMNFINLGINLLSNAKCKWFVTSSSDLSLDLNGFPDLEFYKAIFENNRWLPPLAGPIQNDKNFKGIKFITNDNSWYDNHPTPRMHLKWLQDNLVNKLDVDINYNFFETIINALGPDPKLVAENYEALNYSLLRSADWTRVRTLVKGL